MGTNEQLLLAEVVDLLRRMDNSSVDSDNRRTNFLETRKDKSNQSLCINGNREGLIHFAMVILEIAQKGFPGAHQHFGEIGELDFCEVPFVVCFKPVDWDAKENNCT